MFTRRKFQVAALCSILNVTSGPFKKYVTPLGGGGTTQIVTECERFSGGTGDCWKIVTSRSKEFEHYRIAIPCENFIVGFVIFFIIISEILKFL